MFVATHEQQAALERSLADYQAMVPTVRPATAAETNNLCPVLDPEVIAGGIIEPQARDIDVHALHTAFLRGARQRGGRILTSTGVTGLGRAGNCWTVQTAAGRDDFDVVVNAAGAWCDRVGALAGARPIGLVPKRRTAFTFATPDGPGPYPWPMVIDVDELYYFRPKESNARFVRRDPHGTADIRHEKSTSPCIERIEAVTTLRFIGRGLGGDCAFVRTTARSTAGTRLPGFTGLPGRAALASRPPAMGRFATMSPGSAPRSGGRSDAAWVGGVAE
jgi:D-arginine dehydrogenase